MLVREIMTKDVVTVDETDTMLDAAMIFARSSLRHLPVLRDKTLVGIFTERDMKRFAPGVLSGLGSDQYNAVLETTPIRKVMTHDPMTLRPDQEVRDATELFCAKRFGCMPVVEGGKVVGIVTTTDLLRLLAQVLKDR